MTKQKKKTTKGAWERHGLKPAQQQLVKRGIAAFATVLRNHLERTGSTASELSHELGFSNGSVSNWMRAALPNLREVFLMADRLGVEPAELLRPITLAVLRGHQEPVIQAGANGTAANGTTTYIDQLATAMADQLATRVEARALEILSERAAQ